MRILSAQDLEALVPMRAAIGAVREAFAALSTGRATAPMRIGLPIPQHAAALFMPALLDDAGIVSVKAATVHPENPRRGLPRVQALVVALDASTGTPRGLLEGTFLTALRTGAASGVATDLLARQSAAKGLVIGAGPQARTQALAIDAVRDLREIRIRGRSPGSAERLVAELRGKTRAPVAVSDSPRDLLGADVICAATNSTTPVFDGRDVRAGCHVNGIGSYRRGMEEVDAAFLERVDKIVVDRREAAWAEAGELIAARERGQIGEEDIYAEIGEICAGLRPGRTNDEEITFFKSVGNAVQDAAVAAVALREAERRGVGKEITL